jgi:hypothetical protein
VIRSYKILRARLLERRGKDAGNNNAVVGESDVPFLVLAGMGSIDDPEGLVVFENIRKMLEGDEFQDVKGDVFMAR